MLANMILPLFAALLSLATAYTLPSGPQIEERSVNIHPFSAKTIFVPPTNYTTPKVLYGRTWQLDDGSLLSTWENYSPEPPMVYFPIFRSVDEGFTWEHISNVTDQVNGWGLRYQPFLYQLPMKIGNLPKGTILLAGSSIPTDLSITKIDLYASFDKGRTWSFVSSIARGGRAIPNNGETPVWEPFLMVYKKQLICYYSDQRDPLYGQKLVHQESSDGVNWGPVINDVRGKAYEQRPGMPTVTRLPNGSWIMAYEWGGGPNPTSNSYTFPVYYRISNSPLTFDSAPDHALVTTGGHVPLGSPYIAWSPAGGKGGTLIVSAYSDGAIFINTKLADPGSWVRYDTPQSAAYTRQVLVLDNPEYLHILSAGYLPPTENERITNSVFKLPNLPAGTSNRKTRRVQ